MALTYSSFYNSFYFWDFLGSQEVSTYIELRGKSQDGISQNLNRKRMLDSGHWSFLSLWISNLDMEGSVSEANTK